MKYVDVYVMPVPRKNMEANRKRARKAGKIWIEYGALQFCECVGDDLSIKRTMPFPKRIKLKAGESVLFSWITFKSRAHRDKVDAKVIQDPRLSGAMDMKTMPFDVKRMVYGGFNMIVDLRWDYFNAASSSTIILAMASRLAM